MGTGCLGSDFAGFAAVSKGAQFHMFPLLCRAKVQGFGQAKVSSNVLKQVEQTDLINYGLIPEFVGRFPIISSLQVCTCAKVSRRRTSFLPNKPTCI